MSSQQHAEAASKSAHAVSSLLSNARINYWIRFGCLGISASVFVAWQYAFRDTGGMLARWDGWAWLDRGLRARAMARTQRFLEENSTLRSGDERISPWTLITSAFSHKNFDHFLANTMAFNAFCYGLTFFVSPTHFVGLILTTGIAGSFSFLFQQSRKKFPNRRVRALGMSGITSGVGMATAIFAPYASVTVMGSPVPIWVALGGYTAWDVAFLEFETSTTGHEAHLGGALAGLIYGLALKAQNPPDLRSIHREMTRELMRQRMRS